MRVDPNIVESGHRELLWLLRLRLRHLHREGNGQQIVILASAMPTRWQAAPLGLDGWTSLLVLIDIH